MVLKTWAILQDIMFAIWEHKKWWTGQGAVYTGQVGPCVADSG